MDIIISDKWLREFLKTKATTKQISQYISLCGPSVEKIEEKDGDTLYHIEITTNRIDTVSVYGFAREAAAILPRFNIPAKLKNIPTDISGKKINNLPFKIISDNKLVKRAMGVVLTNIKNWQTPTWMKERLVNCGLRSLNAVVDITNYVMLETGHPSHAFDYDKIKNKKFVIRESKKGESVTSFDGKTYTLKGGDIVFDDGDGNIIDLPGIIGTKNSVVGNSTKNVFFFIDNNDPVKIRNTSMSLAIRTMAASINEKGVDPELGKIAVLRGINLFQKICKAEIASEIFDEYEKPYKEKSIVLNKEFIDKKLGVTISKADIEEYLSSLMFKPKWVKNMLTVAIPSFRALDINIPEDIIEEIARIYGYYNFPSNLMTGQLPDPLYKSQFPLEWEIKTVLKALGGSEVYTLSLVPHNYVDGENSLKLKNPLGSDSEYLRTNLSNSLVDAVKSNTGNYEKLFLYEIANIYKPIKNDLPKEIMVLGMAFDGYSYSEIKGVLETLLVNQLHIHADIAKNIDLNNLSIKSSDVFIGEIIEREDGIITLEIKMAALLKLYKAYESFKPIPKNPPQIEDLTVKIPKGIEIGKIISEAKKSSKYISEIELRDIFNNSYTFRISYQDPVKTLTNSEVEEIRSVLQNTLKEKFNL